MITGDFTMLGRTKSITFPATLTATGEALKLIASFKINRSEWGMTYGKGRVDEPVSLTVVVNAKK
jgi:polyisoprenoid-binding protein YceI